MDMPNDMTPSDLDDTDAEPMDEAPEEPTIEEQAQKLVDELEELKDQVVQPEEGAVEELPGEQTDPGMPPAPSEDEEPSESTEPEEPSTPEENVDEALSLLEELEQGLEVQGLLPEEQGPEPEEGEPIEARMKRAATRLRQGGRNCPMCGTLIISGTMRCAKCHWSTGPHKDLVPDAEQLVAVFLRKGEFKGTDGETYGAGDLVQVEMAGPYKGQMGQVGVETRNQITLTMKDGKQLPVPQNQGQEGVFPVSGGGSSVDEMFSQEDTQMVKGDPQAKPQPAPRKPGTPPPMPFAKGKPQPELQMAASKR